MKKVFVWLLIVVCCMTLTGCGFSSSSNGYSQYEYNKAKDAVEKANENYYRNNR